MKRLRWIGPVVPAVTVFAVSLLVAQPAAAACHRFEISVDPATVDEGGEVTVTVTRDAAVNPSSVEVTSIDGTARAGEDFPAVQRRVDFTTQTEVSFAVATTDDAEPEGSETFSLHLDNGDGCAVNPNFAYGPDAQVTINDNDAAGTTTTAAPTTTATSAAPAGEPAEDTTTTTVDDTTSTSADDAESTDTDDTTDTGDATGTTETTGQDERALVAEDIADDDGGGSGAAVAFAVVGVVLALAAGGGYAFYRRRSAGA